MTDHGMGAFYNGVYFYRLKPKPGIRYERPWTTKEWLDRFTAIARAVRTASEAEAEAPFVHAGGDR